MDETGIDTFVYREYGYAKCGETILAAVSGKKYRRTGIVAAQMGKKIYAPLQYDGTMDSHLFEFWFQRYLLPSLPPASVIVMDNAAFHRKNTLKLLAQNTGHTLLFLPPYSPDLNPIENFWAWLKRHLRKILSLHYSFDSALFDAFQVR